MQPAAFAEGEAVGGTVEDEGARIGQQRTGQAETAVHAVRQGAQTFVTQAHEPDGFDHFVDAPKRHTDGGAQHAELTADRTCGMARHLSQEHTDLTRGMRDPVQRTTAEVGDSPAPLEFEHEPQRRRLARARGSEERCDAARARLEGHVVDGGGKLLAGVAGQSDGLDHSQQDSVTFAIFRASCGSFESALTPLSGRRAPWVDPPPSDLGAQHGRIEQRGTAGTEQLCGSPALARRRAARGHEEARCARHLAVEVARVERHSPHGLVHTA